MRAHREEGVIDAHLHIDLYDEREQEKLLDEAFKAGVEAVVAVSMHLASCMRNRELAQRFKGRVMPAYGFHPEQPLPPAEEQEALLGWIRARHRAGERFAIGEVGLPYYTRTGAAAAGEPFDEAPYIALLERFVAMAAELDRPIALHAVYEDADKACDLLERHGVKRAHFHWFKGSPKTMRRMIAKGYRISVTPDVAYEPEIRAIVSQYPLELMMAETDGPWPFEGPYEGRRTCPAMVRDVAASIAKLKGLPLKETLRAIRNQTASFYFDEGRH
ncbi:TatD family hydrolase [Paenibacillus tarimensis]